MFIKSFVAAALLGGAAGAYAFDNGTMHFLNNPADHGVGGMNLKLTIGATPTHFINGAFVGNSTFTLTDSGPNNYYPASSTISAFCVDLLAEFDPPDNWNTRIYDPASTYTPIPSNNYFNGIQSLINAGSIMEGTALAFCGPSGDLRNLNDDQAAALQLDVWESIYDPSGIADILPDFSATGGNFQVTGGLTGSILAWADTFWAFRNLNLNSTFLQARGGIEHDPRLGQDFITRVRTPEPVTMSLGLAAAGLFVRRRAKAKKA